MKPTSPFVPFSVLPRIIGVDPGKSGGLAFVQTLNDGSLEAVAIKMPDDEVSIGKILATWKAPEGALFRVLALVERVWATPQMGVTSAFSFGRNYGTIIGALCALQIPVAFVSPLVWQRKMGCLSGGDKKVTKAEAARRFPSISVTHATADALLIAEYGRLHVFTS